MKKFLLFFVSFFLLFDFTEVAKSGESVARYTGSRLNRVAFPIGGTGAGMFCIEGAGAISHMSIKNQHEFNHEPSCYAALCVLGETTDKNIARVVEGPVPTWKYFGKAHAGNGLGGKTYGLPRFRECGFSSRFPFAKIDLKDTSVPVTVSIDAWSPFTPPDADASGLPIGAIEYTFTNPTDKPLRCVFSFNTRNFVNDANRIQVGNSYQGHGSIGSIPGGFVLYDKIGEEREEQTAFAFFVEGEDAKNTVVDHCWFRGGWYDAFTIAWDNVEKGRMIDNPPVDKDCPGATLALPFELVPNGSKTIRLLTCWYCPESKIREGRPFMTDTRPVFDVGSKPSRGTFREQQKVSGFLGKGLVNTYEPYGDDARGTLVSPEFTIDKKFLHLLVGGGSECSVKLFVDGKPVRTASGKNSEQLDWVTWKLDDLQGKKAVVKIVDDQSGGWGHILCDHVVLSDEPIGPLKTATETSDSSRILADFEGDDYGDWKVEKSLEIKKDGFEFAKPDCTDPNLVVCSDMKIPETYKPWYSTQFASVLEVADHWRKNYADLKRRSELFSKAFYDTTLPIEVVETVADNLAILKTPTILRQHDGRLWCWEGCYDNGGSCHGSCMHVWTYTQAICHLFPTLERSLRQTEFHESFWQGTGRQAFRANLPITPGGEGFDAVDGQTGGIMKIYREWRIFGNDEWLKLYWPRVKMSMDYMIATFDPEHKGIPEESHHNTYDINFFGPNGLGGSYYVAGLIAAAEMGEYLGQDVSLYKELIAKGSRRMIEELFNGEYFIQKVWKTELKRNFAPIDSNGQSIGYRDIARRVNEEGPKYQYGDGCLSDGVLGFWIAACCGLDVETVPREMIEKHLISVYKYNFRKDLSQHANPQRPSYALGDDGGLLLCSWPRGNKPLLPFVYSDEVWTGIEFQVASHLMMLGHVEEALDIVRAVRGRYDGFKRNPFDEYEWGHFYARSLSSYGMLQGLTGVRYDAVTKTLHIDSKVGDFRSFLSTATGFGTVVYKDGQATFEVVSGSIPVENVKIKNK